MSELELKITVGNTDINIKGESGLAYKIFRDLCSEGLGKLTTPVSDNIELPIGTDIDMTAETSQQVQSLQSAKLKNKNRKSSKKPQLLKDLNLRPSDKQTLEDFMNSKSPASNVQRTTVFIYYLENILGIGNITLDHVYTCYKTVNQKIPNNLQQNLTDTSSSKYGYIKVENGFYSMSVKGDNLISHDLPKVKSSK